MIKTIMIFVMGLAIAGGVIGFMSVKSFTDKPNNTLQSEILVFSNINAVDITQNSVTIVSNTSVPVICEVEFAEYKEDPIFVSDMNVNNGPHTEHRILISDLKPDTRYNYRFQTNYADSDFLTDIRTFTTLAFTFYSET